MAAIVDARVQPALSREFGVSWVAREDGYGHEIAGIAQETLDVASWVSSDSLYADLWRNTDDPAKPPTIRVAPDDFTSAITLLSTLAQHIAMAADCDPWEAAAALHEADDQDEDEDWDDGKTTLKPKKLALL